MGEEKAQRDERIRQGLCMKPNLDLEHKDLTFLSKYLWVFHDTFNILSLKEEDTLF